MNETNEYNLIDERWIPVLMRDGTNRMVSLGEVFSDSDGRIADLALNPYERVAVFRLLLCIAQAALGPERLRDEAGWLAAKDSVGPISSDYLKKWHDRFFLYGPHAFLQPDDVKPVKENDERPRRFNSDIGKTCLARASGNNSTLFDHEATDQTREMSNSIRAVCLLVFQAFSAGGRFSQCKWCGKLFPKNNNKGKPENAVSSPCRENDILFSILLGNCITESIWLNLLSQDVLASARINLGKPIWECNDATPEQLQSSIQTYLGHLVPLSRIVKMLLGDNGVIMGEGLIYPTLNPDKQNPGKRPFGWREPMATVKPNGDGPAMYVSCDPSRMPWRDLSSILAIRGTGGASSAFALRHLDSLNEEKTFLLWTGGLCTSQAKDRDVVEWVVSLSMEWLEDSSIQRYQNAIDYSKSQCDRMIAAAIIYSEMLEMSKVKKDKREIYRPTDVAESIYWDLLSQPNNQKLVQDIHSKSYLDKWKEATRNAAKEAYRRACPAMTVRQMEAFAQGFAKLWVQ